MGKLSQGWIGQWEQKDYTEISSSVYVTILELDLTAMEKTGEERPLIHQADHEIARRRSLNIVTVREALTRLAKEGRILRYPSEDGSVAVQMPKPGQESDQKDPEVEAILRDRDHRLEELGRLVERLNKQNGDHEATHRKHRADMEALRGKLETANNRARKAREELREATERSDSQLGRLRSENHQLRQQALRFEKELEALREEKREADEEIERLEAIAQSKVHDILPVDMAERFTRAVQS